MELYETSLSNPKWTLTGALGEERPTRILNFQSDRLLAMNERIEGVTFVDCTFQNLQAMGSEFLSCRFVRTEFTNAELRSVTFKDCMFLESRFKNSQLGDLQWDGGTIEGARALLDEASRERSSRLVLRNVWIRSLPSSFLETLARDGAQIVNCFFSDTYIPSALTEKNTQIALEAPKPAARPMPSTPPAVVTASPEPAPASAPKAVATETGRFEGLER